MSLRLFPVTLFGAALIAAGAFASPDRPASAPVTIGDDKDDGGTMTEDKDPFAGRLGDEKATRLEDGGGDEDTEAAVEAGLQWLARHQGPNGNWSTKSFDAMCYDTKCDGVGEEDHDTGVTALAVLAFLGAGYGPKDKSTYVDPQTERTVRRGEIVRAGLKWLKRQQLQDGSIGDPNNSRFMYSHAIATLALAEAAGMTTSDTWTESAQSAVDFLLAAQNPNKGWRYTRLCGDNDTSVTSWCVAALHAADLAGLKVDPAGLKGAKEWVKEATDTDYYRTGYTALGTGKVVVPGKNEDWDGHETLTAVGMLTRMYSDRKNSTTAVTSGAKLLVADLPVYAKLKTDYYYWFYGSQALFQFDGPDGRYWANWNKALKKAIVPNQKSKKDGCLQGSWDPSVDRWSFEPGRTYSTALNVLTLETYYRYDRVAIKK